MKQITTRWSRDDDSSSEIRTRLWPLQAGLDYAIGYQWDHLDYQTRTVFFTYQQPASRVTLIRIQLAGHILEETDATTI